MSGNPDGGGTVKSVIWSTQAPTIVAQHIGANQGLSSTRLSVVPFPKVEVCMENDRMQNVAVRTA